jgi:hypothetical protein
MKPPDEPAPVKAPWLFRDGMPLTIELTRMDDSGSRASFCHSMCGSRRPLPRKEFWASDCLIIWKIKQFP